MNPCYNKRIFLLMMESKHNNKPRQWLIVAAAAIVVILITLSCGGNGHTNYTPEQRKAIDSVVKLATDTTQLQHLLNEYSRSDNYLGIVVACRCLGKMYRENNRFTEAIECHRRGLNVAEQLADTIEIIKALNNIGTALRRMGVLDEASRYHYQALGLCDRLSDKESFDARKNRVVSLNGIGNICLTTGNNETADSVFRAALAGEKALGSALGQAINYANLGSIFEGEGRIDSAWHYYRRSMELNREAKSDLGISLNHNSFGRLYELSHNTAAAIKEYKESYSLMEQSSDRWHWLEPCLSLARIYLSQGNMATAKTYIDQAAQVAAQLHSIEHEAETYKLYYQYYERMGDSRAALDNYIKSRNCSDSISNEKNMNRIQNVRIQYETERSKVMVDAATKSYRAEKRIKEIVLIASGVVAIAALAAIAFLYYALLMRKRHQRTMQQLDSMRTSFFTNITHEFRTPLTLIIGIGQQMADGRIGKTDDSMNNAGNTIVRQGRSLLNLINQILDVARVKSAVGRPDYRTGNVVRYLQVLFESYHAYAQSRGLVMAFDTDRDDIEMDFVPDYMNKIVRNLMGNALKFTPDGGRITLSIHLGDGNTAVIAVADNGCGIDKEELPHIFATFYQGAGTGKSVGLGTGVGLSLVKNVVEVMDGTVAVESRKGYGSTFTVTLPLSHGKGGWQRFDPSDINDEAPAAVTQASQQQPHGDSDNPDAPVVLIVEDNPDMSRYIGSEINQRYRLHYASNGAEGLDMAKQLLPDLIITDLMMPEKDGLELCADIRASQALNHIPVIIITARSTEDDRILGIKAGADAYLYKPFNSVELNTRVEKLLEQRRLLRNKYRQAVASGSNDSEQVLSKVDRDFINKLVDVVYQQMDINKFDIESVASRMCLSSRQLNRKVSQITGDTTAVYILRVRMARAKRIIAQHPEQTIAEVALNCGFEDNAYFSKVFKRVYGMTPSQFRKHPSGGPFSEGDA